MATCTVLGNTDEVTTCDCCGRTDLKGTVALELDGETVYFGVVCAARKVGRDAKQIRREAKSADDAKAEAARRAREAAHAAAYAADQAKLDAAVPHLRGDRFRQIEVLGNGNHGAGMRAFDVLRGRRAP